MARFWIVFGLAATLGIASAAPSIAMDYCARTNTAATEASNSIYQSDGLCHDLCRDNSYQLAIVQGESCWCSNTAPEKKAQVSTSQCNSSCPGFPSDVCGGDGLFGYMRIASVGAQPAAVPISTASGQVTDSPHSSSSSSLSSTVSTRILSSVSVTTTPAPTAVLTATVRTVTAGGSIMTVTVTPSVSAGSSPNQAGISSQNSGLSVGAAVGIAIAVIAAVVGAAIVGFCVWRRRRRQREHHMFGSPSPRGSSAGMTISQKASDGGMGPSFLGRAPTGGEANWEGDHPLGRQRSMLMPIDPRIDPQHRGIYNRPENKSHDSVNSLRDDQDYSRRVVQPRVLRATNPDPMDY